MKLVFAGTKVGREYVYQLLQQGEKVIASTATPYGASLYKAHKNLIVNDQKMGFHEMIDFVKSKNIDEIIDCTHPYAINVTENMIKCAKELNIPYRLLERDSYLKENGSNSVTTVENYEEACNYLLQREGKILLAIGSNNLEAFIRISSDRIIIRVLPTSKVLSKCEGLGYSPKNIVAIQGPFSYEMNKTIYKDHNIRYIVTKDSGKSGGIEEKVQAALDNDIEVIMIARKREV